MPQPFASITPEVDTEALRITTKFPRGDAPGTVQRFASWAHEPPIPVDSIPLVAVLVECGQVEVRFDKVEPEVSVGMSWQWPGR